MYKGWKAFQIVLPCRTARQFITLALHEVNCLVFEPMARHPKVVSFEASVVVLGILKSFPVTSQLALHGKKLVDTRTILDC